jgi:nicotinamidase-related amidase
MRWDAREHDPEYPFDLVAPNFRLNAGHTALVVVDMQIEYLQVAADSALGRECPQIREYYNRRIHDIVLPNTVKLVDAFRDRGLKVTYSRNGCMTSMGDEMSARLRALNSPPKLWRGTPTYEIAPEIFPREEDLVIDKLTSGAFTSTHLDHALRNYGVTDIVVTGIFTDMCVLGTARVGAELGYNTMICEDCTATNTERAQTEALLMHARRFGRVASTDCIIAELGAD